MIWEMLQPMVNSLGSSSLGQWLGQSTDRIAWLFIMHLFGLTLLMGPTLVLGIRLLGLGFHSRKIAELTRDTAVFRMAGLVLMLLSGASIFTGGAVSYFEGQWFRRKMALLIVALLFNFTFFRKVTNAEEGRYSPLVSRLTGLIALSLWLSVAVAGRAIAFS
jgi:uncharacterized membrane protein SirB2